MKQLLLVCFAVACTFTQAHGQIDTKNQSFMVTDVVADANCQSEDPWQPSFKQLFSQLRKKADDICITLNIKARLDKNEFFECRNSFLTGVQSFSCLPPENNDCSYGKCCLGGICD